MSTTPAAGTRAPVALDAPGSRSGVLARLAHDRTVVVGALLVLVLLVIAFGAPLLTRINGQNPYRYNSQPLGGDGSPRGSFGGVSADHWFGVEPLTGRDLFAIVAYGARTSILVGIVATLVSIVVGVAVGAAAALFGGHVDRVLSRVIDAMFGAPQAEYTSATGGQRTGG